MEATGNMGYWSSEWHSKCTQKLSRAHTLLSTKLRQRINPKFKSSKFTRKFRRFKFHFNGTMFGDHQLRVGSSPIMSWKENWTYFSTSFVRDIRFSYDDASLGAEHPKEE